MKYRKLRIACSVAWGVACLLLVALWVRSYWVCDMVTHIKPGFVINTIGSNGGTLFSAHITLPPTARLQPIWQPQHGWSYGTAEVGEVPSMFEFKNGIIRFPYFPLVALFAAAVAVPWLKWSRRFSLRTLLVVSTLVAASLGWFVYALRK